MKFITLVNHFCCSYENLLNPMTLKESEYETVLFSLITVNGLI